MRFTHTLRFFSLPMVVLGTALTLACSDGGPTAPDQAPSFLARSGALSVDSRNVRIQCNVGTPCTAGMYVGASSPVTLSYQVDGDFEINSAVTTCPQGGTLEGGTVNGSCYLNVKVTSTATPGRRTGTLVISESTFGSTLTVHLSAKVS